MAKTIKENKRGFVLYSNTLRIAERVLPRFEQRGQLLTLITAYTNNAALPSYDKDVMTCFEFIRDAIEVNCDKYTEKKKRQKAYYEEQKAKSKAYDKMTILENSEKTEETEKSEKNATLITNNSYSESNSESNSESDNVIINNNYVRENNINNNINNSFSNKYTLPEIEKILEKEKINFKQNWLKDFYRLNSVHYKWKYEPIVAAMAYIKVHPESVKENIPPNSARPPELTKVSQAYAETLRQDGSKIWADLRKELNTILPADNVKMLNNVQFAEAYKLGITAGWSVLLVVSTSFDVIAINKIFTSNSLIDCLKKTNVKNIRLISRVDWNKAREI